LLALTNLSRFFTDFNCTESSKQKERQANQNEQTTTAADKLPAGNFVGEKECEKESEVKKKRG